MKLKGRDIRIFVNVGTEQSPVWEKVTYQREVSGSVETDVIDSTTVDSDGWKEHEEGYKSWNIDVSGIVPKECEAFEFLREKCLSGGKVDLKLEGTTFGRLRGKAIITTLDTSAPHDDMAEQTISFIGDGAPSYTRP